MKQFLRCIVTLLALCQAYPLSAALIDLNRETIYARKGFDEAWTREVPAPTDSVWLAIPGVKTAERQVVLKDLPLHNMPRRPVFSLKEYAPENFTFLTEFKLMEKDPALEGLLGVYFANIGENWSVYLNGRLLKSEIHENGRGMILEFRHHREVLIPIDPRILRTGSNILAVRIFSDPTNIDSGFHRSTPFVIDALPRLEELRSEQTSMILIFLYLFFGVYHMFIYIRRRVEKYNLFYALFSVFLFAYFMSRTHGIYAVIPDSTILHRIEYCSLYALVPLFGVFVDLLLTASISRLTKLYAALYALLILVTITPVSNPFAIDVLRVWQFSVIIPVFYYPIIRIGRPVLASFRTMHARFHNIPFPSRATRALGRVLASSTAGNLMLGTLIVVACMVFDIADSLFWSYDYVVTTYGFFVFTMGIALILTNRFLALHRELEKDNEIAAREMALAAHVQKMLLASPPADIDRWDIAVTFRPKYGAAGDSYDFYYTENNLDGIALFDVSGHGVSSALITMMIKPVTMRAFKSLHGESLDAIINNVNRQVTRDLVQLNTYVTCVLLRIRENVAEYVNAGHPGQFWHQHGVGH
ncbi:MAG TPA: SpoIIE family protein phosphatase, partial [Spirochaetota bacterium]|nr:SpoIIE family protein phosphatase [Spirochaetota bacterium]